MPPGPALSAALATVDLTTLSGFDAVVVMKARYRQVSHEQAELFASIVEVGLCDAFGAETERMEDPDAFSGDEIRAALVLTRLSADCLLHFSDTVVRRVPSVHEGMRAGIVDWAKAKLLSDWTSALSEDHARKVCDSLVPLCDKLTTGQIRERLKKHATSLDPNWAQRRYEASLRECKVVGRANDDGTADLIGQQLPPHRVAAACARLNNLARAAKHAGDRRGIDLIRAELFLGMTDGTYEGFTDEEILVYLAATRPKPDAADSEAADESAAEAGGEPAEAAATDEPGDIDDSTGDDGPTHGGPTGDSPTHGAPGGVAPTDRQAQDTVPAGRLRRAKSFISRAAPSPEAIPTFHFLSR